VLIVIDYLIISAGIRFGSGSIDAIIASTAAIISSG
jgi:hypothetical protein